MDSYGFSARSYASCGISAACKASLLGYIEAPISRPPPLLGESPGMMSEPGGGLKRRWLRLSLAVVAIWATAVLLSSCAAGPNPAAGAGEEPAGFWLGLWHGIIFLVTFVISLFTDNVSPYEVANNGNWYDTGFLLGLLLSLGGSGGGATRARRRR